MKMFQSILMAGISLVFCALLVAAPASAVTFAGQNGKIAFTTLQNGASAIWLMDADGNNKRPLQQNASSPAWSPDGSRLAFINNQGQLLVVDQDGRNLRQLTNAGQFTHSSPVWSPSGRQIAFVRQEKTGQKRSAVFSVKASGVAPAVNISGWAPDQSYRSPSWAPDSQKIVYEHTAAGVHELLIKNIKTGNIRQLTTVSHQVNARPIWSPSGKKILFNDTATEIYTIWTDGSHRTVISDGESYQAAWSSDGNKIVFLEDPQDDTISISEPDGSITYIPVAKGLYSSMSSPIWSPDSTKLLFSMRDDMGASDTFCLNLDDQNSLTKLASNTLAEHAWQARP